MEAQSRALSAHHRGDALREEEKWEEAIAFYQEAIRLHPEFSWSHHSLGDCYKKLGDYENAIVAYKRAIALNPDFVWSHYSLAEALEQTEEWSAAVQSYQQALMIEPENDCVPPRLASALQVLIQQSPRNVNYYQGLAEQYAAQGKVAEAISTYQMALQIQPGNADVAADLSALIAEQDPMASHALMERALSKVITRQDVHTVDMLADSQTVALLLKHTHLFDAVYYRACYQPLAQLSDAELLAHYIEKGSAANYKPNPLFDGQFYLEQNPEVAQKGLNPLAHYHCFGYQAGCDPHPFFSTASYGVLNPDVAAADIDPLEHYLAYGAQEGRVAFMAEQLSSVLGAQTPADADYLQPLRYSNTVASPQALGVYCNTQGNYFITEIADFVAAALAQAGHSVTRLSEQDTIPAGLDGHWVIAPHEFFYLGEGLRWTQQVEWLKNAVMVNVEQPQTTWFSKSFHFLRHSKIVFDINVKSAAIMQSLGLPVYWLPLGDLDDYAPFAVDERLPDLRALRSLPASVRDHLPAVEAPLIDRPLDIQFIGTLNERRELFFAESARWLSEYKCFLHMPSMGVPLLKGEDQALDTAAVIGISRRCKILLNIHRDSLPYFEWHRMIFHGLWQNTLVVTEPCHDIPGLVAGEHFVACPLAEMAEKVAWLLQSPEGKAEAERIRLAGHKAFKAQFQGREIAERALQLAARAFAKAEGARS